MSSIRLYVLTALVERGPMHGHAMRQLAEQEHIGEWSDISVGALYGALKRMLADGLIAVVRTEQSGAYPERHVYDITDDGRAELRRIRSGIARATALRPDPFDLAFARLDRIDPDELAEELEGRLASYRTQLADVRQKLEHIERWLWLAERLAFEHKIYRLEAEISWHETLLARVADVAADEIRRREHGGEKPQN